MLKSSPVEYNEPDNEIVKTLDKHVPLKTKFIKEAITNSM